MLASLNLVRRDPFAVQEAKGMTAIESIERQGYAAIQGAVDPVLCDAGLERTGELKKRNQSILEKNAWKVSRCLAGT